MSEKPTLEVPENWDELDHDLRAELIAAKNDVSGLRESVDSIMGYSSTERESVATKDWLAYLFLALGGQNAAAVDVEVQDGGR